jgi:maltose/moltooligosaccharide transporter
MAVAGMPVDSVAPAVPRAKPNLSFRQIWNMCFGFLGLQFGFALQNANVSRIFQTLGASVDAIPALWIAAPLTGLLLQPIVGYCSDRTWTRLGRRRPYFLVGAVLASAALIAMPRSIGLWMAALLLWVLDASLNVSMEPFRALVGDQLGPRQRPTGFAMQGFFIGLGAIIASALPYVLAHLGVSNEGSAGSGAAAIPDTVRISFDVGGLVLLAAVSWTVWRTREYAPVDLRAFSAATPAEATRADAGASRARGWPWFGLGAAAIAVIWVGDFDPQLYIVAVGLLSWGLALIVSRGSRRSGGLRSFMDDLTQMPPTMRQLVPVQFFSWLALFAMWIYTTSAVSARFFGSTDPHTLAYNEGANWVGILFGAYNGFAALAAIVIPVMVRNFGLRVSHLINLSLGGVGLLSFLWIQDSRWLLTAMLGVGFAWASILSLPYALLSNSVPAAKMGLYMGIFNFFIVIPQLVAASTLGLVLKVLFGADPIYALAIGGVCFMIAGLLALRVNPAES